MIKYETISFFVPFIVFIASVVGAVLVREHPIGRRRYHILSIFKPLFNMVVNILIGQKYLVRINGTWSVARGKKCQGDTLYILYGQDLHPWKLNMDDWANINSDYDDKEIQNEIIRRNIYDLRKKYPLPADVKKIPTMGHVGRRLRMPQWQPDELIMDDEF